MKFLGKEDRASGKNSLSKNQKKNPKAKSYPHISFGRYKNAKDQQVLLSHFSGPMRLGGHDAKVKISFSHLVAVQIKEETNATESKLPAPANGAGAAVSPPRRSHRHRRPMSSLLKPR